MTQAPENQVASEPVVPDYARPPQRYATFTGIFGNGRFRLAFIVLLVAACGLHLTVNFMKIHLTKQPVPMRMAFSAAMPQVIGEDWVQVARQDVLEPEFKSALGTGEYLFCDYIRASVFDKTPQEVVNEFKDLPLEQQQRKVHEYRALQAKKPQAGVLGIGLTYYTGKVDTVAHIPERCYLGGGFDPETPGRPELKTDPPRELKVRCLRFRIPNSPMVRHVGYFFHVNGEYENNSLAVREALSNLFERKGYYAKIELSCEDQREAAAQDAMREFLNVALPEIEKALPDWEEVKRQK